MTIQDVVKVTMSPIEIIDNKYGYTIYSGFADDVPLDIMNWLVVAISTEQRTTNLVIYVEK